jgi:NAD-dependent DNA ligase
MKRYKQLFEGLKTDILNQAEEAINNDQPYIAIKHVAKSLGISQIGQKYDELLAKQVDEYSKSNKNSYTFISNVEKILRGTTKPEKLLKYFKPRKPSITKLKVDKAVQKAMQAKQDQQNNADAALKDIEQPEEENQSEEGKDVIEKIKKKK